MYFSAKGQLLLGWGAGQSRNRCKATRATADRGHHRGIEGDAHPERAGRAQDAPRAQCDAKAPRQGLMCSAPLLVPSLLVPSMSSAPPAAALRPCRPNRRPAFPPSELRPRAEASVHQETAPRVRRWTISTSSSSGTWTTASRPSSDASCSTPIPSLRVRAVQAACKAEGMEFEYAFLMDALQAQNITMDNYPGAPSDRGSAAPSRSSTSPGHKEFLTT